MNYSKRAVERREKSLNSVGTKIKNKGISLLLRFLLIGIGLAGVVGIAAGIGIWKGIIDSAPDISSIDATPTGYYSTVYANDGKTITGTLVQAGSNRKYVTLDQVPHYLSNAFVAIEDSRFYEHNGIDIYGMGRALVTDILNRNFNEGASTITQQLIKNNVLVEEWTSESSPIEKVQRKIQEQYIAVKLEQQVDKDWILENYMNSINLGANSLGVEAASQKYFGKTVSELNLSECATIAGITKNPSAYNPITHPDLNEKRRKKVLDNMKEQGMITQEEYDGAIADTEDLYVRIADHYTERQSAPASYNTYFVDAVIDDVYADLLQAGYSSTEATKMIYSGGLNIISTQDLSAQAILDEEVNNPDNYQVKTTYSFILSFQVKKADGTNKTYTNNTMLSYYKKAKKNDDFTINYKSEEKALEAIRQYEKDVLEEGDTFVEDSEYINITLQPQVAMTVVDQNTGSVVALSGGRGDKVGNRTWNRATDTKRQPGSTFKIIGCFAAALEEGDMTLASTQYDEPYTVGKKTFKNASSKYRGNTTIREAITNSINIPTVKTLEEIGVNLGFTYAERFGITSLDESDRTLSLCLGGLTNGVTNLELTGAYAAIANKGTYMEPKFYTVVYDHDGNELLKKEDNQEIHQVVSPQTAWLLTSAMEDVMTAGTGTRAYFGRSMPQAGKSGTTTNSRDCLFAGYTPYYTTVVWGGYDDNSKQSNTNYPKNLWKAVMKRLNAGLPYKDFDMPEDIVAARVCTSSGKLASKYCSSYTEYFYKDTKPSQTCNDHVSVDVCESSGLLPNEYCPSVKTKIFDKGKVPTKTCEEHEAPEIELPEIPEIPAIPGVTPVTP